MTINWFLGANSGATIRTTANTPNEPAAPFELTIIIGAAAAAAELEADELLELIDNLVTAAHARGLVDEHRRQRIDTAARLAGAGLDPLQMAEAERIEAEANRRAAQRENQRRPERSAILELIEARRRRRPAGDGMTAEELNEQTRQWKAAAEERDRLAAEEAARLARLELEPTLPGLEPDETQEAGA